MGHIKRFYHQKIQDNEFFFKIIMFIYLVLLFIFRNTQNMSERMFLTDEVIAFQTVTKSFLTIPHEAIISYHQMQPPFFYWLGHIATKIGTDPLILRSVSVLCYVLMLGVYHFFYSRIPVNNTFYTLFYFDSFTICEICRNRI